MRPEPDPFELPEPLTLRLYRGDEVLFASEGRWLHPLFELEGVFAGGIDPAGTRILDRVTGRAAAFLVARLGVPSLRTRVLSQRAVPILERYGIAYEALERVERIACATEELLGDIDDLDSAYALLAERRRRAGERAKR